MNNRWKLAIAPIILAVIPGCRLLGISTAESGPEPPPGEAYFDSEPVAARLRADVFTLAADSMRGREAATIDELRAAEYLADRLREMGVRPGGEGDSVRTYFQAFDLSVVSFDTLYTRLSFGGMGEARFGTDWLAFADHSPTVMMDSVDVVFAGYGISAYEHEYDDFELVDVGGKLVVALSGAPEGIDSVETYAGKFPADDFLVKWISAAQRGAAGLLVIGETQALDLWDEYATVARGRSMQLAEDAIYAPVMPYMFASADYGERLLDALRSEFREIEPDTPDLLPFHLARPASLHLLPRRVEAQSRNVIGYIPGARDPGSFVALGAHFDHLGVSGDSVYNGADDNASGVAAVLAVAGAFATDAAADRPADRSIAFVFHGAEEKGLLGARYLTSHPETSVFGAMDSIAAHVNLDMVGREHPDSLFVVGAYRLSSQLGILVDSLNQHLEGDGPLFAFDRAYDDPDDPEKIFERSDHYAYAQQGVPAVFFTDGMGANWKKGSQDDDYHSPTDDPQKIDYAKIARVSRLVYEVARHAARTTAEFPIDGMIPDEAEE